MNKKILLCPNGYGQLRYLDEVESAMKRLSYKVLRMSFSSQGAGLKMTADSIEADLLKALNVLPSRDTAAFIHCSGLQPFLRLADSGLDFSQCLNSISIYSVLASPQRLLSRFYRKLSSRSMDIALDGFNLDPLSPDQIEKLRVPVRIIHPYGDSHETRATESELANLSRAANVIHVTRPKIGYEILNVSQRKRVEKTINDWHSWN